MDDVFLAALLYSVIMSYFCIVEDTLNHFPYTVKLSKGILFGFEVEFVGIKITNNRNPPVEKNMDTFSNLSPPSPFQA